MNHQEEYYKEKRIESFIRKAIRETIEIYEDGYLQEDEDSSDDNELAKERVRWYNEIIKVVDTIGATELKFIYIPKLPDIFDVEYTREMIDVYENGVRRGFLEGYELSFIDSKFLGGSRWESLLKEEKRYAIKEIESFFLHNGVNLTYVSNVLKSLENISYTFARFVSADTYKGTTRSGNHMRESKRNYIFRYRVEKITNNKKWNIFSDIRMWNTDKSELDLDTIEWRNTKTGFERLMFYDFNKTLFDAVIDYYSFAHFVFDILSINEIEDSMIKDKCPTGCHLAEVIKSTNHLFGAKDEDVLLGYPIRRQVVAKSIQSNELNAPTREKNHKQKPFKSTMTQAQLGTMFRIMRDKGIFNATDTQLYNYIGMITGWHPNSIKRGSFGVNADISKAIKNQTQIDEVVDVFKSIIKEIEKAKTNSQPI